MTLNSVSGIVRFKVKGQNAQPKWIQSLLAESLDRQVAPPEALRYQCRIATDANENLEVIDLPDGETLTLHYKKKSQFGKNSKGQAFLTATFVYSGDGQGYCLRWVGDAVPKKMQQVAVAHDQGKKVAPTTIALDLSKATVTPSWRINGHRGPSNLTRSFADEKAQAAKRRAAGKPKGTKDTRYCGRLTAADIA